MENNNNELNIKLLAINENIKFEFKGTKKEMLDYLVEMNSKILNSIGSIEKQDMIIYANNIMLRGISMYQEKLGYKTRI